MSCIISIRRAQRNDIAALVALQWRAALANAHHAERLLANPDAIELPASQVDGGHVFIAEAEGEIAGFAVAAPRPDDDFELDGLFVEPTMWRRGIGTALVEHCARRAAGHDATILHVIGEPTAEGFYTSCGFRPVGIVPTRFGPALAMERLLRDL